MHLQSPMLMNLQKIESSSKAPKKIFWGQSDCFIFYKTTNQQIKFIVCAYNFLFKFSHLFSSVISEKNLFYIIHYINVFQICISKSKIHFYFQTNSEIDSYSITHENVILPNIQEKAGCTQLTSHGSCASIFIVSLFVCIGILFDFNLK